MTKQQIQSKFIPLIEKKPIKALGIISKIALGLALVCLIIGFAFMFKTKIPTFTEFLCQSKSTDTSLTITEGFGIGWICFIMIMIFILTSIPYYLIHLLTFKRIIITPIMLVLSILTFGMILGCLFVSDITIGNIGNNGFTYSQGIYKVHVDSNFSIKYSPSVLGIVTLICLAATFVVSCIPAKKKASK